MTDAGQVAQPAQLARPRQRGREPAPWAMQKAKTLRDMGFARGDASLTETMAHYIEWMEGAPA